MLLDYHIHTFLCGHATGQPAEYVQSAIECGLDEIGFSDHAPLPAGLREGITMVPGEMEGYLSMIDAVKKEFAGRIAVKTGLEVDYPLHDTFRRSYFSDERIDYFIGSCHFIDGWAFDHPDYISGFDERDIDDVYRDYYRLILDLVRTGTFNIIGHFDLVKKFGHRPGRKFNREIETIARSIAANDNCAVEISTAGLRKPVGEIYPSEDIVGIFFENNVPLTLGSDAHEPREVGHQFQKAVEMLKKAGYRKISGFAGRKRYDVPIDGRP